MTIELMANKKLKESIEEIIKEKSIEIKECDEMVPIDLKTELELGVIKTLFSVRLHEEPYQWPEEARQALRRFVDSRLKS